MAFALRARLFRHTLCIIVHNCAAELCLCVPVVYVDTFLMISECNTVSVAHNEQCRLYESR
jgi:hypothetical protein